MVDAFIPILLPTAATTAELYSFFRTSPLIAQSPIDFGRLRHYPTCKFIRCCK
jgi:hypothetical protein